MKAVIAFFLSLFHIPNLDILSVTGSAAAEAEGSDNKLMVVVAVIAVIFTGIVVYLLFIDRKVGRIEKQIPTGKS
ncbi:MAG TPA: CcmD family protein [Bacteroidia bacterium]|jgi:CcmD family protein|nr:CcmD family protein [Bacteroidia bacterium]MBP7260711.1 CcmD family protein [Bacteroidia bacterium]MBP9180212.1 CcmD family protein [Bacteroidia bacterium]MBP9724145.1 CcmD family protein [Bacteroidia bacterium]HLP32699.1 CcmD family protein [Bacteroidia bacterium]